jgi:hypothetical protein
MSWSEFFFAYPVGFLGQEGMALIKEAAVQAAVAKKRASGPLPAPMPDYRPRPLPTWFTGLAGWGKKLITRFEWEVNHASYLVS